MRRWLSSFVALLVIGALLLGWALHRGRHAPQPIPPAIAAAHAPVRPAVRPQAPEPPAPSLAAEPTPPAAQPPAPYWIRGIAMTPDRQPIQEFELQLFSHYAPSIAPQQRQVFHDARGEFELACAAGPFDLLATAAGFMPGLLPQVAPAATRDEAIPFEIVLVPGGRIQGTVRTIRGEPIAGALVQLAQYIHQVRVGEIPAEVTSGSPELQRAFQQALEEQVKQLNPNPWTDTGLDGRFTLTELPQGTYPLTASHPYYLSVSQQVVLHPGSQLDEVTLTLPDLRPASILVTAIDGQGAPLAGVAIHAESARGPTAGTPAVTTGLTTANGTFRLADLAAGLYLITGALEDASAPGVSQVHSASVSVGAGQEKQVRMIFEGGATILGQVDRAGQPVANIPIVITQEPFEAGDASGGPPPGSAPVTAHAYAKTVTDAQGAFEAHGLVPGAYQLSVMDQERGRASFPFTIHPSDTRRSLIIHLATTVLLGMVRDAHTAAPIPNATVRSFPLESFDDAGQQVDSFYAAEECHAFSDAQGAYRCDGLTRGRYTLDIQAPGYGRVQETLDIALPEARHDLMLQPAAQLIVTVRNLQQLPLPGVYVTVFQPDRADYPLAALTDEHGMAHWTDLEPGVYEIRMGSGREEEERRAVPPDATVTLTSGAIARAALTAQDLAP